MQDHVKRQTCFTSNIPANEIISRMEGAAQSMGFRVETRKYKVLSIKGSMPLQRGDVIYLARK